MLEHFGFVLTRCDLPEIKRIGGKSRLVTFWRSLLLSPLAFRLSPLAAELLRIHSTISPSPGLVADALSFGRALRAEARAILAGAEAVTRETAAARLAICHGCEHLERQLPGSRCALCHCYVRRKTKFRTASCPAGKW